MTNQVQILRDFCEKHNLTLQEIDNHDQNQHIYRVTGGRPTFEYNSCIADELLMDEASAKRCFERSIKFLTKELGLEVVSGE